MHISAVHSSWSHLRRSFVVLLVSLVGSCLLVPLMAQQRRDTVAPGQGKKQVPGAAGSVISDRLTERIVAILEADGTLRSLAKQSVVRDLERGGQYVSEQAITDETLFRRIQEDRAFRMAVGRELERRGYISEEEFPELASEEAGEVPGLIGPLDDETLADESGKEREAPSKRRAPPKRERTEIPDVKAQPRLLKKPSPYGNVPSLEDLYAQVPSRGSPLERFGEDVFANGSGNYEKLPIDMPVGPDYVIGPGDGLSIDLWGSINQRLQRDVDREGRVSLPEVGTVLLAGRTLRDAQDEIEDILAMQFNQISADVSLSRLRTVRVYVVGDVARPGPYDISSLSTALNALYMAGGPTLRGSMRTVRHYRGEKLVREVDLYDLILKGVRSEVRRLEPGDTILVPPMGPQVTVDGMVRRPAVYEVNGERSLAEVLKLAGGVLVSGTTRQIRVERIEAHQRRVMLSLEVLESDDQAVAKALAGFEVQDGDYISIAPILPYSYQTVYLDGHVFRPGKHPYRQGMGVSDLVPSYRDLLPEPADRGEIIRLEPPTYRPVVMPFDLTASLNGGGSKVELQPFDTVRIYGRYELDPPKVAIYGEVLRPGEYPLSQGMTASELVRMAGGFKRSAFSERADLSSYVIRDGQKVLGENREIAISDALAGNPSADAVLKDGDVLTVRQLAGWSDIGASVTLNGEVQYPGTYGISEGERLSSLLRRTGGFRDTAYPAGALLERVQVRRLAEQSKQELIRRLEQAGVRTAGFEPGSERAALVQAFQQQRQQAVERLRSAPSTGRQVIKVTGNMSEWENTPADVELRAGDVLTIPKRPTFVLVQGQVYSPSAITFTPGKAASWYLKRAGGTTEMASKNEIFVIRADGSVVGKGGGIGWWKKDPLDLKLQPGDTVVVPEKVLSGSSLWKTLIQAAQVTSSIAIAARVATSF